MHLKSLTVRGFKSFASATTLEFEPGITCIVGPNGSGKSNVVDAIAWVMGEQGAKPLRGGKMEDVIFAGTSTRPPLGRAEVELLIDNSDGALPIDYAEVRISRIMFRGGGSEYSINGRPVRLLDVQELLSDSGIGHQMHVIVGQGQVESVLAATPEDRRGFIEEAGGVLKHRKRKEKALRKLDAMAANLVRLTDLTGEVRRQLKPLGRQALLARRAAVIQADARDAKLRLLADDHATAAAVLGKDEADEAALVAEREGVRARLAAAKSRQTELERCLSDAAAGMHQINDTLVRLTALQERFGGMIQLAAARIRHLRPDEDQPRSALDPEELERQAGQARRDYESAAEAARLAASALATRERSRLGAERQHAAACDEAQLRRQTLDRGREALSRLHAKVAAATSRAQARENEIGRLRAQVCDSEDAIARLRAEMDEREDARRSDRAEGSALSAAAANANRELEEGVLRLDRARLAEREHASTLAAATARAETLEAALSDPTTAKDLAEAGVSILGPVASLVSVAGGYETAMDAALSVAADAIAVDGWDQAEAALMAVQTGAGSRVTLLVAGQSRRGAQACDVADRRRRAIPPGCMAAEDVVGLGEGVPGSVLTAVRAMLRGVVIADTFATARGIIEADPSVTVVTLAGEVVGAHLIATGRGDGGAIQLRDLVRRACADRDAAAACASESSACLASVEAEHRRLSEAAGLAGEAAAARASVASKQVEAGNLVMAKIESMADEAARVELALEHARAAHEEDMRAVEALRAQIGALAADGPPEAELADASVSELETAVSVARDAEVEARLAARSADDRAAAQKQRAEELAAAADAQHRAVRARKESAARRERQAEVATFVLHVATEALAVVEASLGSTRQERDDARVDRAAGEAELAQLRDEGLRLSDRLSELTDHVHRDEVARAQQRLRIEQLQAKALEEFGIEPRALMAEYGPDALVPPSVQMPDDDRDPNRAVPEPVPFVRSEQEARLRVAEKSLALLGRVNPLALEEFTALEERHAFLVTQLDDLKSSRKDLLEIVFEVDDRVRGVFADAFADVQREFADTFARLFPGGDGRLVLTDPDDMLNTGVEIEACPAGKRIKRLSLLSGGERSMAAMAFLVALFRARPSPFYLLDEVEAALDDTNLIRMVGLLQELRESSQLLIVTHQKRTMEMAEALYGIAMREGVTRVVSQRVKELQDA